MPKRLDKKKQRLAARRTGSIALSAAMLILGSALVMAEGIEAYGARMCAESGIAPEDCSFVSDPAVARHAEAVRSEEQGRSADKTATLLEHGRRVCEEENVPLEDCRALPSAFRDEHAPAAFLTAPAALPPVDPALVPAAPPPPPPPPARHIVRETLPPAQPIVRPVPVPVRTASPALPPRAIGPAFRDVAPPPPPVATESLFLPPPLPADPVFVERRAQIVERVPAERVFRRERVVVEERFVREERRSGRCLRAVRYSAPPSYRYVTC